MPILRLARILVSAGLTRVTVLVLPGSSRKEVLMGVVDWLFVMTTPVLRSLIFSRLLPAMLL